MITVVVSFFEQPPAWLEIGGYALVALVALELAVGRKRLSLGGRGFRRTHFAVAWSLAALMGIHAFIGIAHSVVGYLVRLR